MRYLTFFIVLFHLPLYAQDLVSPVPEKLEIQEEAVEINPVPEKQIVVTYKCSHKNNDLIREVNIIHLDQGCEVSYTKAVGTVNEKTRSLWKAKNSTEYCDKKGQEFVNEKLQEKYGWVCIDTMNN